MQFQFVNNLVRTIEIGGHIQKFNNSKGFYVLILKPDIRFKTTKDIFDCDSQNKRD